MKLPSDAQARFLSCLEQHGRDGDEVFAGVEDGRDSRIALYVPRLGGDAPRVGKPMALGLVSVASTDVLLLPAALSDVRASTYGAAMREGWVESPHNVEFDTPCIGVCWKGFGDHTWHVTLSELALTDLGRIALGIWRQRQLAKPAERVELAAEDRPIIAMAEQAERLGFAVVPKTDEAKGLCRRLARGPFARRGWGGGASTRSIVPTALGAVEVNPALADDPDDRS